MKTEAGDQVSTPRIVALYTDALAKTSLSFDRDIVAPASVAGFPYHYLFELRLKSARDKSVTVGRYSNASSSWSSLSDTVTAENITSEENCTASNCKAN